MSRHLVKNDMFCLQGWRNAREICKKPGRIYFPSNTLTDRKFHFQVKSVVIESRGSHINAFLLPKTTLLVDRIDLVTVFDAILTSSKACEKLQCLYTNLMSNNFRKTAAVKKISMSTKATKQRIALENFGGVPELKFFQRLALDFPYICL